MRLGLSLHLRNSQTGTWIGQVGSGMDQTQAGWTSLAGTCWAVWANWADEPASMLYHSLTLMVSVDSVG